MKRNLFFIIVFSLCSMVCVAQRQVEGTIDKYIHWTFDGQTLTIYNDGEKVKLMKMPDYDNVSERTPWHKKKIAQNIARVVIGDGISHIGSCAFADCEKLSEVIFQAQKVESIGWGAFMNCKNLRTISFPTSLKDIETIAFANCSSLSIIRIPEQCRVGDQAFVSCDIKSLYISQTSIVGLYAFAKEEDRDGIIRHSLYNGEILGLPIGTNVKTCAEIGLAPEAVGQYLKHTVDTVDYDAITSEIDTDIPNATYMQNDVYALIIGNQNYRWNSPVKCAIHDAHIFKNYCEKALGIPAGNIKALDDATKMMINEEAFYWLENYVPNRTNKRLIVYYAGHGVPDHKNSNESYILPCDVRGSDPQFGIKLSDFYTRLGDLGFEQTSVFMDACFSGGFDENNRAIAGDAEDVKVQNSSVVVFSAAKGNEEAQQYAEQGHGLFTYYLLKELQNRNHNFGRISDNIHRNVQNAIDQSNNRLQQQTPNTQSGDVYWRNRNF